MSVPHRPIPPLEVRERAACMCEVGAACSSFAPGHAVHLIQARLASATPTSWVDAMVEAVDDAEGVIVARTLEHAEPITVWNGAGAASQVRVGSPVALHERYHVLADGTRWFNVLRVA